MAEDTQFQSACCNAGGFQVQEEKTRDGRVPLFHATWGDDASVVVNTVI